MQEAVMHEHRFPGSRLMVQVWNLQDIFKGTSLEGEGLYYWTHPEEIPAEDLKAMYRIHRISLRDQFRIENVY